MLLKVYSGSDVVTLTSLPTTSSTWESVDFLLSDYIALSDSFWVEFFIQDAPPGHLVEGGVDQFVIKQFIGVEEIKGHGDFLLFPNPSNNGNFTVSMKNDAVGTALRVLDLSGREVLPSRPLLEKSTRIRTDLTPGIYLVEVRSPQSRSVKRLVISP